MILWYCPLLDTPSFPFMLCVGGFYGILKIKGSENMESGSWAEWASGIISAVSLCATYLLATKPNKKLKIYYKIRIEDYKKTIGKEGDEGYIFTIGKDTQEEMVLWAVNYSSELKQIYLDGIEVTTDSFFKQKLKRIFLRKKYEVYRGAELFSDLKIASVYPNTPSEEEIIKLRYFRDYAKTINIIEKDFYGSVVYKDTKNKKYRARIKFEK